jgi:glycerol-3-phosphate acyltransferase PlsX
LGAIASLPMLKHITNKFNYKNYAGAIVLGVNAIAIKTHGSADRKQFYSALKIARQCIANNFLSAIKKINYD